MGSQQRFVERYRSLGLLLLLVAAVMATIVASCGGGGSSNGGLCEQCGGSDGPCQSSAFVVPGATRPEPCPTAGANLCVQRDLICRRKVDSAQQRCYPANQDGSEVDFQFRCDGSRPGGTLVPATLTPTSTALTPTPAGTPVCGNGVLDPGEQCEIVGPLFGGATCNDFCQSGFGTLICSGLCTIDTSACTGPCP
jgi:hypothetical protein